MYKRVRVDSIVCVSMCVCGLMMGGNYRSDKCLCVSVDVCINVCVLIRLCALVCVFVG